MSLITSETRGVFVIAVTPFRDDMSIDSDSIDRMVDFYYETGADGLVPVTSLPDDYYLHDEVHHALVGKRTRRTFQLGQALDVVLHEANTLTGSMVFHLAETAGEAAKPRPARPTKPDRFGRGRRR